MAYHFSGWATKNNLKCADGRTIRKNAFATNNGQKVPLVWNHQHNDPDDILGHAILTNKEEGVWADCEFNNTPKAQHALEAVKHGDVTSLSIWANNLQQIGDDVIHGVIREVSLVVAGANPGAFIESVLAHGIAMEDGDEEGIFYTGDSLVLAHANEPEKPEPPKEPEGEKEETIVDVLNSLSEKQKEAVAVVVGQAISDAKKEGGQQEPPKKEEGTEMKHNVFSDGAPKAPRISRDDMRAILSDAEQFGSLRKAINHNLEAGGVLAHALDATGMEKPTGNQTYGFNDASMLFPDYRSLIDTPEWISRRMEWVQEVMNTVHRTPFSRIKSVYADITDDEARAKGYIKGKQKKEEVFSLLKRTTSPQTVYKLQKMDRDDVADITDFDVVAWIKAEMRLMLDEEIARAILIGDGRLSSSDDKISEDHIRPVVKDVPLFNVPVIVDPGSSDRAVIAKATIDEIIRSRKYYKGSGNPTFYTTEDMLTEMLLLEDAIGHKLYKTAVELATALRVSKIVTVEAMDGYTIDLGDESGLDLIGTVVNLLDYNVGADKGGAVEMFDDFDLNFNKHEWLIETRCSGALIKPFSAMTFGLKKSSSKSSGSSNSAA